MDDCSELEVDLQLCHRISFSAFMYLSTAVVLRFRMYAIRRTVTGRANVKIEKTKKQAQAQAQTHCCLFYCDDGVICCTDPVALQAVLDVCSRIMDRIMLKLNLLQTKTACIAPSQSQWASGSQSGSSVQTHHVRH